MKAKTIVRIIIGVFTAGFLSGCQTFVPVTDVSKIDDDTMTAVFQIKTFIIGQSPAGQFSIVGPVDAYSCKHLKWDKPASKGNALTQLKYEAYKLGANAIMEFVFDTRGTDALGTNCWETVQASGIAIKLTSN